MTKKSGSFLCPHDGGDTRVYDTEVAYGGLGIKRRRKCLSCGKSCTTTELLREANPDRRKRESARVDPQLCVDCGKPYSYLWYTEDEFWLSVSDGASHLCIPCFADRADVILHVKESAH